MTNIIPVYSTRGDAEAFLIYPHLFNRSGEWVGFVTPQREVYSVLGYFVGRLTNDPRILRKRTHEDRPRISPPARPQPIRTPNTVPLARMMSDIPFDSLDVLQDAPELLHPIGSGEMMQDMD